MDESKFRVYPQRPIIRVSLSHTVLKIFVGFRFTLGTSSLCVNRRKVHEQQISTNDIMQFFAEQMREVTRAQEKQLKKLSSENKLLRSRLTEMMANMTDRDLVKAKKVIIRPKRVPGPAIEFKGKDLMNFWRGEKLHAD